VRVTRKNQHMSYDKQKDTSARILAVGGGKGGAGKSVTSILLAAACASSGRELRWWIWI